MIARLTRIVTYTLSGSLLILFIAAAVLLFWGDTLVTRYIPALEAELGRYLRSKVQISKLKVDILPSLGVQANGVRITPQGGCGSIVAASAELRIDLRALLSGRYVINALSFTGIQADLNLRGGVLKVHTDLNEPCSTQKDQYLPSLQSTQQQLALDEASSGMLSIELKELALRDAHITLRESRVHRIQLTHLVGAASLSGGLLIVEEPNIELLIDGLPIGLSAQSLRFDMERSLVVVADADISLNNRHVSFSGEFGPGAQLKSGRIQTTAFDAHTLVNMARRCGVNLSSIQSGEISVSGDVSYSSVGGFALSVADLSAKRLSIVDSGGSYSASSVRGPLRCVMRREHSECNSDLRIEGFGYETGAIKLSNVSGLLEGLKVTLQPQGDVAVSGVVKSSSLQLSSPTVDIKRVVSVSAPMELSFPAAGGYVAKGDVFGRGIELRMYERELTDVGGTVRISLSSKGDTFTTSSLSITSAGRPIQLQGSFATSPSSYSFRDIKGSLGGGQVTLTGDIQRKTDYPFSARIGVNGADVTTLATALLARSESPFDGQIRSMNLVLEGALFSLPRSLQGSGDFNLMSTRIRGFDLTRALADAISSIGIPNLMLSKEKLTDNGLDKMGEGAFTIVDEKLKFSALTFYRQHYTLQATGTYSFSREVDLRGAVTFMKQTLSALGGGFDRLGALLGRLGKVQIPIFIRGQVPNISVTPDAVTLVKDNSGLTLVSGVLGTTLEASRSVADFVLNPFDSRKKEAESSQHK